MKSQIKPRRYGGFTFFSFTPALNFHPFVVFFLKLPITLCNQDCYLGQKHYDLNLTPDCTFITVHCTFTAAHNHHVLATEMQNQSQTFEYRHKVQSTVQFILAKNHPFKLTVWKSKASMCFVLFCVTFKDRKNIKWFKNNRESNKTVIKYWCHSLCKQL